MKFPAALRQYLHGTSPRSLRSEILRMLMIIVAPIALLWAWYVHNEFVEARLVTHDQMDQVVLSVAQALEQTLHDQQVLMDAVAQAYSGSPPAAHANFAPDQFARIHGNLLLYGYGVRDMEGRVVYSSSPHPQSAEDVLKTPWGQRGVRSDRFEAHGAVLLPASQRWVVMLTTPVRDRLGRQSGFVYFALDLLDMNQRLLARVPPQWVVPVFDQTDRFLLRSVDPAQWIGKPLPAANADMVRGKTRAQFEAPDISGRLRLYAVAPVGQFGWRVFAGAPLDEALANAYATRQLGGVAGVLMALVVVWVGLWRASAIARPMQDLTHAVRGLSASPGTRLQTAGPHEVDALADSFNTLLDELERHGRERQALAQHYATLLQNARDIVLLFDEQGRIVEANHAAVAAYGYARQELLGKTAAELRAPEARATAQHDWQQTAQAAGALFETAHLRRDGSVFAVEVSSSTIEVDGRLYRQSFVRDITQRKSAQQAQARAAQLAQETLDAISSCVAVLDAHGNTRFLNRHWQQCAQLPARAWMLPPLEIGQNYLQVCQQCDESDAADYVRGLQTVLEGGQPTFRTELNFSSQGSTRWMQAHLTRFASGSDNVVVVMDDVTSHKTLERALQRQTRALRARSAVDHALLTSDELVPLLVEITRSMVESAGYQMAWVGQKMDDAAHSVRPLASAGDDEGYLQSVAITWDDSVTGQGPTGVALRTQRPAVSHALAHNPAFAPWRAAALVRGYRTSVALPLVIRGTPWGVLNLYSADVDAFDSDEMQLLQELSANLAYGIDKLDLQSATRDLRAQVQADEQRLRLLIEHSPAGMFALRHGVFVYANPRMEDILGYPRGALVGQMSKDLVLPEDWGVILKGMQALATSGNSGNLTVRALRKDGSVVQLGLQDVRTEFGGETAIIGMAQDIGERLQAQEKINHYIGLLEQTTEATLRAVAAMVEQRDPYTAGHERRVGALAEAIGQEMGLSEHQVRGLRLTGMVHDIGKISVPAELLSKPTRLSETEMALIRLHAQTGYEVLKEVEFPWPVADVIRQHHERMDGSGYPQGLQGDAILLEARIMMVADVVESMASHRPYRASLGLDAALAEIAQYRGTRYDPAVVDACVRLFREKAYQLPK